MLIRTILPRWCNWIKKVNIRRPAGNPKIPILVCTSIVTIINLALLMILLHFSAVFCGIVISALLQFLIISGSRIVISLHSMHWLSLIQLRYLWIRVSIWIKKGFMFALFWFIRQLSYHHFVFLVHTCTSMPWALLHLAFMFGAI